MVADRGDSDGQGWAAIDDFEFLYDVFQVRLLDASVILTRSTKDSLLTVCTSVKKHPTVIMIF